MRAILLAAGRGSRLGPLAEHIPKALLECGGQTLIERTIKSYTESGIDDIIVGVGWKGHKVRKHIEQAFHNEAIRIVDVPNYMHGPLQTLVTSLESNNEPCIIGPADSIIDSSILLELIESYKQQSNDLIIAVDREASHGTDVYINESGDVSGLGSKKVGKYLGKSAMLVVTSSNFLDLCKDALAGGMQTIASVINHAIELELSINHAGVTGEWFDIDSIRDLLEANRYVLQRIDDTLENCIFIPTNDTLEIGENLVLDSGIHIGAGVRIKGPSIISADCHIGENVLIGPNVCLGINSFASVGCSISESIVLRSSRIKSGVILSNVIIHGNQIFQV